MAGFSVYEYLIGLVYGKSFGITGCYHYNEPWNEPDRSRVLSTPVNILKASSVSDNPHRGNIGVYQYQRQNSSQKNIGFQISVVDKG
jgi:hypothetical protein